MNKRRVYACDLKDRYGYISSVLVSKPIRVICDATEEVIQTAELLS
jgi:hypothetical protein